MAALILPGWRAGRRFMPVPEFAASAASSAPLPDAKDGPAFDPDSGAYNVLLEARFRDAIQSARDAGGAVSAQARGFVAGVWPHALEASRRTGIPPAFMVAQAALGSVNLSLMIYDFL